MKTVKIRSTRAPSHRVPELTAEVPPLGGFHSIVALTARSGDADPPDSATHHRPTRDVRLLSLQQLANLLPEVARNQDGQPMEVALQAAPLGARQYEARVYHEGKLPLRPGHVHDLFNLAMWCRWPRSKAALNALQVERGWLGESKQRTAAGNAATLLDECGVVLLGDEPQVTSLLRAHRWQELFVTHRGDWGRSLHALTLGHGLLEQLCQPFDGLTAKCVVLPRGGGQPSTAESQSRVDDQLARWIAALSDTRQLLPLPVLGIPGWHRANEDPSYYQNTRYFRPLGGQRTKHGP